MLWLAAGIAVIVAFALIVINATTPPTTTSPANAATAPGITAASATLIQLDRLSGKAQQAPDFALTDQRGTHIDLHTFAGRSVVLMFNDDECQDLCTLLAQDVVAANHDLASRAKNVAFVSINANPYYPNVGAVADWTKQHDLGGASNWYFGTGDPATLAATAQDYGVPIEKDDATRTVVHGTEIFFIDPSGREVALGQFGTDAANTSAFGNVMAQMAVDLLPKSLRGTVGGTDQVDVDSGSAAIGSHPKSFDLPSLTGGRYAGVSSTPGQYTVVNFWASTCSACAAELPDLQKAHTQAGEKVRFLGVDVADNPAAAKTFAEAAGVSYPLALDAKGTIAGRFQITGLPYTVILDPKGKVIIRHPGDFTAEQLEYILESLTVS